MSNAISFQEPYQKVDLFDFMFLLDFGEMFT